MDVDGWVVVESMQLLAASHSLFICLLATPVSVKLGKKKKEAETQLRLTRIREQSVSANTDSSSHVRIQPVIQQTLYSMWFNISSWIEIIFDVTAGSYCWRCHSATLCGNAASVSRQLQLAS